MSHGTPEHTPEQIVRIFENQRAAKEAAKAAKEVADAAKIAEAAKAKKDAELRAAIELETNRMPFVRTFVAKCFRAPSSFQAMVGDLNLECIQDAVVVSVVDAAFTRDPHAHAKVREDVQKWGLRTTEISHRHVGGGPETCLCQVGGCDCDRYMDRGVLVSSFEILPVLA